jgi:hypothetical protein
MTTHPIFNRWLWGTMLAAAFLIWVGLQCSGCGGAGPTRTMAKVVRATVEAQCADLDPVVECLEKIDRNARLLDNALERDGGR